MAGNENPDQGQTLGTIRVGEHPRNYVVQTVLISVVFYLVLFVVLVLTKRTVPSPELVFIALVPFLVLLISSGRIQELRFGDISMKFQKAIQDNISPDIISDPVNFEQHEPTSKTGTVQLEEMIDQQGSTLAFRVGGRYDFDFIKEYLRRNLSENPNFKYILFTNSDGGFKGLMKAEDFVSYIWLKETTGNSVVDAIQSGDILDNENVIKIRIQEGSTLGEARRKFDGVDEDLIAVVDLNETFIGVLTNEEVNSRLLSRLVDDSRQ